MKRALLSTFLIVLVLASSYFIIVERELAAHRTFLLQGTDHAAIAKECLALIEEHKSDEMVLHSTNLPLAIRAAKPMWVSVSSNHVTIMKTGGHYHMGFFFGPRASSSNLFDLVFQEEKKDSHDLVLYSVSK